MKQLLFFALLLLALSTACTKKSPTPTQAQTIDTLPMVVMRIQQASRLYTAEYRIHKIVTHTDKVSIKAAFMKKDFSINLPATDRRVAIPMDATVKAYVDFTHFTAHNVHIDGERITITLPNPRIVLTQTKINHKEVKQFVDLTRSRFTDEELTSYERQGRKQIIASLSQMPIIEDAQRSAARQLVPMLQSLGYKEENITITFNETASQNNILRYLEVKNGNK